MIISEVVHPAPLLPPCTRLYHLAPVGVGTPAAASRSWPHTPARAIAPGVSACWIYAINHFGYPPSIDNAYEAINRVADLGFTALELEAVFLPGNNERNLGDVYSHRHEIRRLCDQRGLKLTNFFAILPDLVDLDPERRARGQDLYERSIEITGALDTFNRQLRDD